MAIQETKIEYHSELMKNYTSHIPVKGGNEFKALLDYNSQPLLLSVGSDNHLRLIYQNTDKSTPWTIKELEKNNKPIVVSCFDVFQASSGEIIIAYSCIENGQAKIFYSKSSPNNFNDANMAYKFEWREHKVEDSINAISHIKIDGAYLMFSTKTTAKEAYYYYAEYGSNNIKLNLPELGDEIINFKVGSFAKKKGVFLLYSISSDQNLIFQSFPDPILGKTTKISFSFDGALENIDIIRKKNGSDFLLACGDNVYLYESKKERKTLIEKRRGTFIDIKATNYDDVSSIWITERDNDQNKDYNLLFLTDNFYDENLKKFINGKWTSDLLMKTDVRQFACIKGAPSDNHLILISNENKLSHFWQDAKTNLWNECLIHVEPLDEADAIIEFSCYTATINLKNKDTLAPVVDEELIVSASSNAIVTINGIACLLTPDKGKSVKTDAMGNITFIYPVQDEINVPLFYIDHDGLDKRKLINPAHKLEERLELIESAEDFINAKTDDGEPLWEKDQRPENSDLKNGSQAIQQLLKSRKNFISDEELTIESNSSNRDITWGLKFTDDYKLQYLEGSDASIYFNALTNTHNGNTSKLSTSWNPLKPIGHAIGSIFHWVSGAIGKISSFVINIVDGITNIILEISGNIFKFVIDVIEQVFPFVKFILDALLITFKTVLKWIGKLIGWNDIWEAHKVIARILKNGMRANTDNAINNINFWKQNSDSFFDDVKNKFHHIGHKKIPNINLNFKQEEKFFYSSPEYKNLNSPGANWSMYQLQHGGILDSKEVMTNNSSDSFNQFIDSISNQFSFIEQEIGAIVDFILHPDFSLHGLIKLITPIFDKIIDSLKIFIDGTLSFIVGFMEKAEQTLTQRIKIPFLSSFYKFITNILGESEELTFVNAISLLVAIPFTIIFKLSGKGAPFKDGSKGIDDKEFFDQLLNNHPKPSLFNLTELKKNNQDVERLYYSYIGGTIGSLAGIIASGSGIFSFADPASKTAAGKFAFGFSLLSQICTIPMPVDDSKEALAAEEIRMTQFLITIINTIISANILRLKSSGYTNLVVSIFSFTLNISANVVKNPGLASWFIHITSRSGSLVSGGGKVFENPEITVAGQGISVLASLGSFILAINSDEEILSHAPLVG